MNAQASAAGVEPIVVIGDVMLDRYVIGVTGRISPEAPVPVVLDRDQHAVAGGAANVAMNIAALGASVEIVGIVGQDADGSDLESVLAEHPRVVSRLVRDAERPTVSKTRIMSGRQQIVRLDREDIGAPRGAALDRYLAAAIEAIERAKIVVLSDYAKGALFDPIVQQLIAAAKRNGAYVIVDPKRRSFAAYRGADLVKPNLTELAATTGIECTNEDDLDAAFKALGAEFDGSLLVTRAEKGMSLLRTDAAPVHIPTAVNEVADVSGAGDTVLASLAVSLAEGYPLETAVDRANVAAGLAVAKLGTATITRSELETALASREGGTFQIGMLADREHASRIVATWKGLGERVAFTNGCFDLVHSGHIQLLTNAAREADRLVVGLNADASVRRLKGPTRPVQSELHRATVIGALRVVDLVVLFEEDTPIELIDALSPDILIKGADYKEDEVVGGDLVKSRGGRVVLVPLVEGQSSTNIISRMAR